MLGLLDSFVFGFGTSLHCAGMCGPLAVAALGGRGGAAAYHAGRAGAYGVAGAAAGMLGDALGARALQTPLAWVALVLGSGLLALAVGVRPTLARLPGLSAWLGRVGAVAARQSAWRRGAALGLLTPLLPCGLLWTVLAAAAVAGGPLGGTSVTLGFAAGSLPLLALAQLNADWLRRRLGPNAQRALLLAAALVLLWRGSTALGGGSCCG